MARVKYRYRGDGAWVPGLPARDLTAADLRGFTQEQRELLAAHMALPPEVRLYEPADDRAGEEE